MTQTSLLGKAINQFYGMLKQYLRIWMGVFCIIMLCTAQRSLAQEETLKSTVKANFGVDADVKSGILSFTDSIAINTDDWFLGPTGRGVIDVSNQAIINRLNSGENITTTFGMSQSLNSIIDGNLWLDAVFLRDYYSHNNEKDETIFGGGGDKNFDNPTTWTIKEGSVPPKNDIIDVYGHLRQDVNSALWLFGAVSTRTQNGDNYIDFEYFRNTISYSVSQGFSSLGSECGHTAYKFNTENGEVEVDGDIILSVNYINGGTRADFRFYAWIDSNELKKLSGDTLSLTEEDFKAYNNLPNKRFEFGDGVGGFEFYNCDNDSNNSFGYARISLINTTESIFAQDNTINSVETPSWGTIATDGSVKYEYEKLNFLEFALNTTLLGLDGAITNGACSKPLGTVIVKTRTSASFTSELKDLAGPFTLGANPQNTITISKPEMLTCSVTEITLTTFTSAQDVSYYEWFKDGLPFDDGTPGNTLTITQPGIYSVKANFYEGCEIKSNEVEVIQNSIEPNVSASGGVIVCSIGQIQLNGTISSTNPNANLTFEWTGPNNFVNSTELSPFVSLEGIYTLTVTDIDNGCISFASAEVTSESITPLEIQCPATINVQCKEDVPGPDISTVIIINGGNPTVQFVGDVSDNGTCPETITRTYSATDGCGDIVYCTQIITVSDSIDPEIVDVADYQLEGCAAEWPGFLTTTWSDNCSTGGSINSDAGVDKGSSTDGSIEYREYTFTVKDGCDNTATETTLVSKLIDATPLDIQCPQSIEVQCKDDVPGPDISTVIIISGGNPTVQFVGDVSDNGTCPETITRTYSATDGCGNVAYCTQIITVNDTIDPEIVDVADYQLEGCAAEWPGFLTTTWSDNCSTGGSINSDTGVNNGNSTDGTIEYREYTFTVSDNCGNTALETTVVSRLIGNDETIQGNDIELILGYGEFNLYELLPEGYIPGGIWILFSTNPDGLDIEISNSGSIFISDELPLGDYVFHYTIDCTVIEVTVYLISPPPPCDDGEKIFGNEIELCRDYGEYDLRLLLPEEYNIPGGTWTLYSTQPEGLDIEISDSGLIFVSNEIIPGIYIFHYTIECIVIEVNVKILEDINCVKDCEGGEISTALTPNGDRVNDTFYAGVDPDGSCTVDVQIFNRWGNKIFEAQNYKNDWNGTVNSNAIGSAGKITTGTYYYILRYKTDSEIEQTVTGYFYAATE